MGEVIEAWLLFSRALKAYSDGFKEGIITAVREDGYRQEMRVAEFFSAPDEFSRLHNIALAECKGRVLDVGAGAGRHALSLQHRGNSVCALDVSPVAVSIMKTRGIHDARVGDIRDLCTEPFDTVLLLMNGIGAVGTKERLRNLLSEFGRLVRPGGCMIFDSWDFTASDGDVHVNYYQTPRVGCEYSGETIYRFQYQHEISRAISWLFIEPDEICSMAIEAGLGCRIIAKEADGAYVAVLER